MKLRQLFGFGFEETLMTSQRGNLILKMSRHVRGKKSDIKVSIFKLKPNALNPVKECSNKDCPNKPRKSKFKKSAQKPKLGKLKPFAVIPLEDFRTVDALVIDAMGYIVKEARKHL